jgi:hypothetical protein
VEHVLRKIPQHFNDFRRSQRRADVYTDSKKFIVRFGMLKVEHLFFGVVGKWLGN